MLSDKRRKLIPFFVLIVIGAIIYGFNLNNGLFWDDEEWVINNFSVHQLSWHNIKFWFSDNILAGVGQKSNYYRPFLLFTFATNYALSGIKPISYHVFSNAIHILNAIFVFTIFSKVLKNRTTGFVAALLFLVHPIATEAVTYISGRGDALYVMFTLLGLWLFYEAEIRKLNWFSWQKMASIGMLILGLLSREVAIVFPILSLVFVFTFLEIGPFVRSIKNSIRRTWPYFVVVIVYGILRLTILNFNNTLNFYSSPNVYSENLHVRLFTFMHVLFDYLRLIIVPVNLHMERSVPIHLLFFDWPVWVMTVLIGACIYFLWKLYQKNISSFRFNFFVFVWFFAALGPVSGITPINAQIYEHWLYLPSIAIFLFFAYYFSVLLEYARSYKQPLAYGAAIILTIYSLWLSFQSIQRNIIWGRPIEFYLDILKYEPNSVRINNNLGNQYHDVNNLVKAEEYYTRAIKLEDIFPQPHYNLGKIFEARGDIDGAIQEYGKAIKINPRFYYPYQNLAIIYAGRGNLVKAREMLEQLLVIRPYDPAVYYNLALVSRAQGNSGAAILYAQEGLAQAGLDNSMRQALEAILTEAR